MKEYRSIGLMSGTSLDGVDAAVLRTDGQSFVAREGFLSLPYPPPLRESLRACLGRPAEEAAEAEAEMTRFHAAAVAALLEKTGIATGAVDVVGFHGQTISHAPARGHTCQIGDGALLARLTGIRVVNDFRSADVAAGGQGAPLAPAYHGMLATGMEKPVVFLNIGGVANVTYVGADGALLAFDTGPGNALMDDWARARTGREYDADGALAGAGRVDRELLARLLAHTFFSALPPKSLDRDAFASDAWEALSPEDGAATLAAFTAGGILRARGFFPAPARRWIVCGGGRRNAHLMSLLRDEIGADVAPIETLGLDGDATEAEAFACLAVRSLRGLPLSFPGTTGVKAPLTGGRLHGAPGAAA